MDFQLPNWTGKGRAHLALSGRRRLLLAAFATAEEAAGFALGVSGPSTRRSARRQHQERPAKARTRLSRHQSGEDDRTMHRVGDNVQRDMRLERPLEYGEARAADTEAASRQVASCQKYSTTMRW